MRVLIASNDPSIATVLRRCLGEEGIECPLSRCLNLDDAARVLADRTETIDVLLVVLPERREPAFEAVERFRSLTDVWMVATGDAETPGDVLDMLHHGADDFIDRNRELASQVAAVLRSPRMLSETDDGESSQLVAVTSASGGCGASTIAVNLAVTLAKQVGKCGLFDLDLEKGDLAYLLNVSPRHTIAELCRNAIGLDRNMLEKSLAEHESGVSLLAASLDSGAQAVVDGKQLSRILDLGSAVFPSCVVDLGRHAGGTRHVDLLRKCHRILIVLKLDFIGVCNTRRLLDALEREHIDTSRVILVANRRGMPVEIPPKKAGTILGRDIDHCIPDDEVTANFCVNCGTPYTIEAPKKGVAKALRILASALRDDTGTAGSNATAPDPAESGAAATRKGLRLVQQAAGVLLCMRATT